MESGLGNAPVRPTIAEIQRVVCAAKGIDPYDMRSPCRKRVYALPRQVAMALARELTGKSYPQLGRAFGGRDHTTVLFAVRKIRRAAEEDERLASKLETYREAIAQEVSRRPYAPIPVPPDAEQLRWASRNKRPALTHHGEWVEA